MRTMSVAEKWSVGASTKLQLFSDLLGRALGLNL